MALCSVTISRILPTLLNVSFNMKSTQVLNHGSPVLSDHLLGFHLTWDREDTPFVDWQDQSLRSNPIWSECKDDNSRNDLGIGCFSDAGYIDINNIQGNNAIKMRTFKPPISSNHLKAGVISEINPSHSDNKFAYVPCDITLGSNVPLDTTLYRISPTIAIIATLAAFICLCGSVLFVYTGRNTRNRIDVGKFDNIGPSRIVRHTPRNVRGTTQAQRNSKPSSRHGIVMTSKRNRIQPRDTPDTSKKLWPFAHWIVSIFGRVKTDVVDTVELPQRRVVAAQGRSVPRSRADVASARHRATSAPRSRADVASARHRATSAPRSRTDVASGRRQSNTNGKTDVTLTRSRANSVPRDQTVVRTVKPAPPVRPRASSAPRSRADIASGRHRPRPSTPRSQTPRSQTPRSQTPRSQSQTQPSRSTSRHPENANGYTASITNWFTSFFTTVQSDASSVVEIVTVPTVIQPTSQKQRSSSTPRSRNDIRNRR